MLQFFKNKHKNTPSIFTDTEGVFFSIIENSYKITTFTEINTNKYEQNGIKISRFYHPYFI